MNDPHEAAPAHRSRKRDADVNVVSRLTRGIAALAILGTAVFGGLAATTTYSSKPSSTSTASASTSVDTPSTQTNGQLASAAAPTTSTQPPVAASGGS